MRVVSLLPSATEIVCALGHGDELVGRSAECDYPWSVRALPVVMRPRSDDSGAPSGEIDRRVQTARSRGDSLYHLDVDLLRSLRPDVLLTQDLCGVCSVTGPEVEAACAAAGVRPQIVSLTPRSIDDVWRSVESVGRSLDDPRAGRILAEQLRQRSAARPGARGARVAVLEWLDPPILAGLWAPEMIERAGGRPAGTRTGEPGVRTGWAALERLRPELVVVSPCSFSVDRTRAELDRSGLRPTFERLRPELGTYLADEAYFSRPGPRLADGIELLRHLMSGRQWSPPMPVEPFAHGAVVA